MAERLNITLGTAGHVDHGKTSLVKNLTGCDTDFLKEEKERGMSIDLGYAPLFFQQYEVGIVDVPGHESFIRTMVAGSTGMDCVLFVVAADDGVMPQTREHLDILSLLGLQNGLIAMTKADRVPPARLQEAEEQIRAQVQGTFLAGSPIVPVSNVTGEGLSTLVEELGRIIPGIARRDTGGPFRLPIDRAFAISGFGTVVTGIAVSGSAAIGDELELLRQSSPTPEPGRLRTVQVYQKQAETAVAGQCAALNIPQWKHKRIKRGDVVVVPGFFAPHEWILCRLRVLPGDRNLLRNGEKIRFHAGTSEVAGTVYLLENSRLAGGEEAVVQIRLNPPLVVGPRDHFIVRMPSPPRTVAGGQVLEGLSRRLRRAREETLSYAAEKSEAVESPLRSIELSLRRRAMAGATAEELALDTMLLPSEVAAGLEKLKANGAASAASRSRTIHREAVQQAAETILHALEAHHKTHPHSPGVSRSELADITQLPAPGLDAALILLMQGRIAFSEATRRFALAGWKPVLPEGVAALCEQIESLFQQRLFNPPSLVEVVAETRANERRCLDAINILKDFARIAAAPGGMLFHADAVAQATARVQEHIRKDGRLESVDFKYLLGTTTRKYALPLLDHLDAIGVTRRVGNTRFLHPATPIPRLASTNNPAAGG